MKELKNCIQNQISIDTETLNHIVTHFEEVTLPKGAFLLKSGTICREMAFIASGYLRMYDVVDGKEITFWIGSEGKFITSLSSFIFQTNNLWNIQAITPCKVYTIRRTAHFELSESTPKWLAFDNLLLANSFALLEKNMFSQLHTTAKQRFDQLLQDEPELFNNVPLQYIASMLGIAPESLSRLRKVN
ncbi:Crp/Fnr family transcriptional regulator [Crocinitomix catalasitica]|uniref:Crp/Fnr family transcriptional regulator n=1 Tax=Crocinitomix catalasitica TaxID=184607 RepID=UPI0004807582|nr:Crp/Fnr family transcriptional regulator [Crocinitomix catalasitica]